MKYTYQTTQISYQKIGKGKPVVLIHGFLENKKMWKVVTDAIATNHTVYTIDLLGHGESDGLCDIHTMEQQAKVINNFLEKEQVLKATIIGHSMGGYISLAFAKLFPEKITALGLLNSHPFSDDDEKRQARERAIKSVRNNHIAYVKAAIPSFFAPDNRSRYKEKIKKLLEDATKMQAQNITAAIRGMKLREDHSELFCKGNDFPKLWIIGIKDPLIELEKIRAASTQCENVAYIEISEGHMSYIENQKEMPVAIKKFLEEHEL